jgi:hypothetical protein
MIAHGPAAACDASEAESSTIGICSRSSNCFARANSVCPSA